jgi:hypothetical protein
MITIPISLKSQGLSGHMPYIGYMTKSAEELKELVKTYEATLERHNTLWKEGNRGIKMNASGRLTDNQFEMICDAVAENLSEVIEVLAKAGIELHHLGLQEQYKEPYHEFHAKVGESGHVGKHMVVPGYPYRRKS